MKSFLSATTVSASTWPMPANFFPFFNGCIATTNLKAPASASPSFSASSLNTAAAYGPNPSKASAPPFTSPSANLPPLSDFQLSGASLLNSIHSHHHLFHAPWILAPRPQCFRCLFQRHDRTYRPLHRKSAFLQHSNHFPKIVRHGVSRTQNVQFLLNEPPRFIAHRSFCVADIHDASGKRRLLHRSAEGLLRTNSLNDDVRPAPFRQLQQPFVQRFGFPVDRVRGARCSRNRQFFVVHVHANRFGSPKMRGRHRSQADPAAPEDGYCVFRGNPAASRRVESDRQRFDQAEFLQGKLCWKNLFCGNRNIFGQGAVALHTQRFIVAARIRPAAATRSTFAATRVR